jgi:hypothetical protein
MRQTKERGITSCWQGGFHAYDAGPCLESIVYAVDYRNRLDFAGVTWWSQDLEWPPRPPEGWEEKK